MKIASRIASVLMFSTAGVYFIAATGYSQHNPSNMEDDYFFYANGRRIDLTLNTAKIAVRYRKGLETTSKRQIESTIPYRDYSKERLESSGVNISVLSLDQSTRKDQVEDTISNLRIRKTINYRIYWS